MTDVTRRTVLLGAAAVPLVGCAKAGEVPLGPPPAPGQVLTKVTEVPVGSGTIVDGTLVTQPTDGVFKGFAARCTHAGCALSSVVDGAAVCACHGSRFGMDGEVLRGPAVEPLAPRPVTVRNGEIVVD